MRLANRPFLPCALSIALLACGKSPGVNAPASVDDLCGAGRVIEDGENDDGQILRHMGRSGYLYTYADEIGSTVSPTGEFIMSSPGAAGSKHALRSTGVLAKRGEVFAGLGLHFTESKRPYDASAYKGISFHAKRGAPYHAFFRLRVPDVNTDPAGGICTYCFNDFGFNLELTEEWQRFVAPFDALEQESGWGEPRPEAIDTSQLMGVQWQVTSPGAMFDVWIDDVEFLCELPKEATR